MAARHFDGYIMKLLLINSFSPLIDIHATNMAKVYACTNIYPFSDFYLRRVGAITVFCQYIINVVSFNLGMSRSSTGHS